MTGILVSSPVCIVCDVLVVKCGVTSGVGHWCWLVFWISHGLGLGNVEQMEERRFTLSVFFPDACVDGVEEVEVEEMRRRRGSDGIQSACFLVVNVVP